MYIDGIESEVSYYHTLSSGEHILDICMKDFINGQYMFYETSVTEVDFNGFNSESLTATNNMFDYCKSLINIDNVVWNFKNVSTMRAMFTSTYLLNQPIIINNIDNLTNVGWAFSRCASPSITFTGPCPDSLKVDYMFYYTADYSPSGTFYYDSNYDYSKIIAELPEAWTAVPI